MKPNSVMLDAAWILVMLSGASAFVLRLAKQILRRSAPQNDVKASQLLHHHQLIPSVVDHLDGNLTVLARFEGRAGRPRQMIPNALLVFTLQGFL